jgi:hypothetical protein
MGFPLADEPKGENRMRENITNRPDDELEDVEKFNETQSNQVDDASATDTAPATIDTTPLKKGMAEKIETIEVSKL